MNTWAPVWSGLVDSSVWEEPDPVFRVFMAMMSLKDSDHVVRLEGYRLARRIHMDLPVVESALVVLQNPDTKRPEQEFDGRRIRKVEDGWLMLNGEKYRKMVSEEMRKARNRRAQQAFRDRRQGLFPGKPLAGEVATLKHEGNGDQAAADRVAASSLPVAALPVPPGGENMDPEAARKLAAHLEEVRAERELKAKAGQVRAVPVGLAPVPVVAAVGAAAPVLPAAGPVSIEEALRRGAAAAAAVPVKPTAANPLAAGWAEQIKAVAKEGG